MKNQNWTYKKLGEISSFRRGLTYSKKDEVSSSTKQVLRANNIELDTHTLNFEDIKCIDENFDIAEDKKLKANTIFICMSSGSMQHLGKVAFVDRDYDYAFGGFMGLIVPNADEIHSKYLFYSFLSSRFQTIIHKEGKGININNLKFSDLSDFSIPVPPLPTQRAIVAELDTLNEILDKKRQQLKELDTLAQSIFYDMFGDPVENEKGWEVKKFSKCFSLKSGDGLTAKQMNGGCYPVYGGNGITGYHSEYNIDGNNIIIGRVGALCGNVKNVAGKVFVTDNAFVTTLLEKFDNIFVLQLLSMLNLRNYAREALQPVVSNTTLKNINIVLPPLFLQQSFAQKIEAIEKQKELINVSIAEVETLLNATMDKYFG